MLRFTSGFFYNEATYIYRGYTISYPPLLREHSPKGVTTKKKSRRPPSSGWEKSPDSQALDFWKWNGHFKESWLEISRFWDNNILVSSLDPVILHLALFTFDVASFTIAIWRHWVLSLKWQFRLRSVQWLVGEKNPDADFFFSGYALT